MLSWLKNHPIFALAATASASGFTFIGNLLLALSDGQLSHTEINQLLAGASFLETMLLVFFMQYLKKQKKDGSS